MTRRVIRITALSQALLIKLLLDGTRTCAELADETGLHIATVYQYTQALHHVGAVHICDWREDAYGAERARIYRLGHGEDVPQYAMTPAERQRRYRQVLKRKQAQRALTFGVAA